MNGVQLMADTRAAECVTMANPMAKDAHISALYELAISNALTAFASDDEQRRLAP
jgi:hypothetical protein